MPLWVSVGGFSLERLRAGRRARSPRSDEVEALELNLSCPNVDEVPENVGEVVAAVRAVDRQAALREALGRGRRRRRHGAGRRGRGRRRPQPGQHGPGPRARRADAAAACSRAESGGLSGPALRPVALAAVHACRRDDAPADRRHGRSRHADATRSSSSRPARTTSPLGTALFADPERGDAGSGPSWTPSWRRSASPVLTTPWALAHDSAEPTLDRESRVRRKKSLHIDANMSG